MFMKACIQEQTFLSQYKSLQHKGQRVSSGLAASYSNDTMKHMKYFGYTGRHMMTTSYATYIKFNAIHTYIMKHLKLQKSVDM